MKSYLLNWKTTLSGVGMIVLGVCSLLGVHIVGAQPIDPQVALSMIVGGVGLIFGKDLNVSGLPKAIVMMAFTLGVLLALFAGAPVRAADNQPATTAITKLLSSTGAGSACTPTSCSGVYVGAGLGGIGTNLDVIGNGLNGSAFAGGVLPTLKFGYLYAQNGWLFGAEFAGAYQASTSATANGTSGNQDGLLLTEGVKFGGNFSALLGQTSSPITIPPSLANAVINIYAQAGAAQHQISGGFASGAYSGAGVLFDVGPHSFVDVDYKNIQYGATKNGAASFNSENVITASFNYKF